MHLYNNLTNIPEKLNSIDARIVLQALYETQFRIFDHINPNRRNQPLASVAIHEAELLSHHSTLDDLTRVYITRGIGDLYKLSLIEFLELPRDIIQTLITIAEEEQANKTNALTSIEKELTNISK